MSFIASAQAVLFSELDPSAHFKSSDTRIDSLFFGVMLRYFHYYHADIFKKITAKIPKRFLVLLGVALCLPEYILDPKTTPHLFTFGYVLVYAGAGLILAALINEWPNKNPFIRCLAFIGKYSYSIFLWHLPARIIIFLGHSHLKANTCVNPYMLSNDQFINLSAYIAISIAVGIVMSKLIEMPFLKIRDRLFPSRSVSRMV